MEWDIHCPSRIADLWSVRHLLPSDIRRSRRRNGFGVAYLHVVFAAPAHASRIAFSRNAPVSHVYKLQPIPYALFWENWLLYRLERCVEQLFNLLVLARATHFIIIIIIIILFAHNIRII